MINKNDLVSVIIRTKNRPNFLQRAIDSVCSQTYNNIEIIIVNDGGNDVTDIVKHYESVFKNVPGVDVKRSFVYIQNKISMMRANAANIGLEASRGKYICLLDDDDYFYAEHLSRHIEMQKKQNCLWSISKSFESIETENGVEKVKKYNYPLEFSRIKFYFFENYYPSNSIVFQRKIIEKVGKFDSNLRVLEDWDLWIRMFMEAEPCFIDEITSVYTTRNGSSNVRMSFEAKGLWKDSFKKVMEKYKNVYKDEKVCVPLNEIDSFLSGQAIEWYTLTKENEELRDSFAYKIYRGKIYRIFKKFGRVFKKTRG